MELSPCSPEGAPFAREKRPQAPAHAWVLPAEPAVSYGLPIMASPFHAPGAVQVPSVGITVVVAFMVALAFAKVRREESVATK